MSKQFFFKNLTLFLVPLLIPTFILGTLSIVATNRYIQGETAKNNSILLEQIDRTMETIMNETESLNVTFANPEVLYSLEDILRTQTLSLNDLRLLKSTRHILESPANARSYIESIYVYVRNANDQFLASGAGLTKLSQFHDTAWFDSFERHQDAELWAEQRAFRRYAFEEPIRVTSIYRSLYSTLRDKPYGVVVLNIYNDPIERQLQNMTAYEEQTLAVLDPQGHLLFRSREHPVLDAVLSSPTDDAERIVELEGDRYVVARAVSSKLGWIYLTIAPERELKQFPFRLSRYTLFFVLLSFVLGLLLTYILTRRNMNHIRHIITLLKRSERGQPLDEAMPKRADHEYEYITQKIITNFIEQNRLKIELSEKRYKLQSAEWKALQAQINPHFLFNTLETIYWKVLGLTGKPNDANRMLEHLSDLLKYSLDEPNRIVPLGKEIRHSMNYVQIQSYRYKDKFTVDWDLDPDDNVYGVPKLLLQPLIENSIYHGIKEKEGTSRIKIKVTREEALLRIAVIDDGIGMTKERLAEMRALLASDREPSDHIGMLNTDRRMKLIYGNAYGIRLHSKRGWGTVVSLAIPIT